MEKRNTFQARRGRRWRGEEHRRWKRRGFGGFGSGQWRRHGHPRRRSELGIVAGNTDEGGILARRRGRGDCRKGGAFLKFSQERRFEGLEVLFDGSDLAALKLIKESVDGGGIQAANLLQLALFQLIVDHVDKRSITMMQAIGCLLFRKC